MVYPLRKTLSSVLLTGLLGVSASASFSLLFKGDSESPNKDSLNQVLPLREMLLVPPCQHTFSEVHSGRITPRQYFEERWDCLPEIVEARQEGILAGFLYFKDRDSERMLEENARRVLTPVAENPQQLEDMVRASLRGYYEIAPSLNPFASVFPPVVGAFGRRVPRYIVLTEGIFSTPELRNDRDVESNFTHELEHIKDDFYGIRLGDLHLTYNQMRTGEWGEQSHRSLVELRARYMELKKYLLDQSEEKGALMSKAYFAKTAHQYAKDWRKLQDSARTPLELRVAALQFQEFNDIKVEWAGDVPSLAITVGGEDYVLTLSGQRPWSKEEIEQFSRKKLE